MIVAIQGLQIGQVDGLQQGDRVAQFGNMALSISYSYGDGNDIGLIASSIPEPNCCLALFLAAAAISVRRKRI